MAAMGRGEQDFLADPHDGVYEPYAHAERWVGSLRRECLDRIVIVGRRQLEQIVRAYISHHNEHRPHRSLEQRPPACEAATGRAAAADPDRSSRPPRRSHPRVLHDRRVTGGNCC
jgi:hypothetical protein